MKYKASPENTDVTHSSFTVPCRISTGALGTFMNTLSNMYPAQFVISMELYYNDETNETTIQVATNGERWPGQFSGIERTEIGNKA